jgi:hypothetical protein
MVKNRSLYPMVPLFLMFVLQWSYAGQGDREPFPKQRMDEIKRLYGFDKWAGKVKTPDRRVEKLGIDPNFFDGISRKTRVFTPDPNRSKELDLNVVDRDTGLEVSIELVMANDPMAAHVDVIKFLSLSTFPGPISKRVDPNDPNDPHNVGDVCFVPIRPWIPAKSKKPVIRDLVFCRNNVFVVLRNSGDETKEVYPDLGKIAVLIDRRLKEISKPTK